jgi:hypothetical protein
MGMMFLHHPVNYWLKFKRVRGVLYFICHPLIGLFNLSTNSRPVVFQKIRQRLFTLGQSDMGEVASINSPLEREASDLTELRLIEWCNFNRVRLGMLLAELSNSVKLFPKRGQLLTAIVLRRAIWNWIDCFPGEFEVLIISRKRMVGGPEFLFDHFSNISELTKRKNIYWPIQSILLVLCPDLLGIESSKGANSIVKRFFELLRKNIKSKVSVLLTR